MRYSFRLLLHPSHPPSLVARQPLLVAHQPLLIAHQPLLVAHQPLLVAHQPLLVAHQLPFFRLRAQVRPRPRNPLLPSQVSQEESLLGSSLSYA
ncbi:hypothetical protein C8R42DRAFT_660995 [Lentinula raphanica]|nr:hypothetical protein C8R42DRAFT_660995 [Lentinula raphanica]